MAAAPHAVSALGHLAVRQVQAEYFNARSAASLTALLA
jgi:hypothetical protein